MRAETSWMPKRLGAFAAGLLAAGFLSPTLAQPPSPDPDRDLTPAERHWVDDTLAGLSLEERAAQMVFVRVPVGVYHPRSPQYLEVLEDVEKRGVGGVVVFRSERDTLPPLLNELQAAAQLPLLVTADFERSAAFRIPEGVVSLPYAMAIGATRSPEAAHFVGELTAREARALGIHWTFAPVADVNNNPANPVIHLRSFGEDPELVAEMTRSFVAGARAGGLLTTAKHFPGHGDTAVDSHLDLPVIAGDRDRLHQIELAPFRAAIEAGVDSVMLGHLSVPALDPTGAPATLSHPLANELLRRDLGFEGLVVTDAMEMRGLDGFGFTESLRRAVLAGADVLLLPEDAGVAIETLVLGVEEGVFPADRIDSSVRRILETKVRLGLQNGSRVDPEQARHEVGRPEDASRADEIAAASITLLRNEGALLPLRAEGPLRLLHLVFTDSRSPSDSGRLPAREIRARGIEIETRYLGPDPSAESLDGIAEEAPQFSHVLVSSYLGIEEVDGPPDARVDLLKRLAKPVVLVSYRDPYLLRRAPTAEAFIDTFGPAASSQRAAVAALFGEAPIGGKLPVTIPGVADFGFGIELPRRPMGLPAATPAELGLWPRAFDEADSVLRDAVESRAFPGAVLAVGYRGRLVHLRSFGKLSWDPGAAPVEVDTIYDLASLTKVVVTTALAMMMVDDERLDLDATVASYLPRFQGPDKNRVTVRHLLTHSSGIDWWAPLHLELEGSKAYVERIQAMDLVYEPGSQMKYSDLGIILLGEILERISGETLEDLARERLLDPLGMEGTGYRPDPGKWAAIAPTEEDPWRERVLQGEVHDENAFALGGVAPHAGLFGTAPDLARFAQMLLNRGVFEHQRLIAPATVDEFTRDARLPAGSRRALGWDTKSPVGSSAGTLFSPDSFGHTGFTGTSIWIDRERELFVILLTNRVHPSRENRQIRTVRPAVADAVVRGLETPPTGPVRVGLDRIRAGEHFDLENRRIGLVVHGASVALDGTHAIDVFGQAGLQVVRLLTPEHGLGGEAAAGEAVGDSVHGPSGIPVVSLYGAKRRPAREDLTDLDVLVFDLQGAGVRFYTYVSTLIGCLEAAAEAAVPVVVLDRPNPLGGERVEGPISAPRDQVPASFVNLAPGPLVHGMTLGEMARLVGSRLGTMVSVVPMLGWERAMTWRDTGRPWTPPSPNLRTAEAALAYPGVALLEATNVSEGRGTGAPFLRLGAPWLDPDDLELVTDPAFELRPTEFRPTSFPAAPNPKYLDETCRGYEVRVREPERAEPYRLGVQLLGQLQSRAEFTWLRDGEALTWLVGTPRLLDDLRAGRSVEEILEADAADHREWRAVRRPFLLYPESDR